MIEFILAVYIDTVAKNQLQQPIYEMLPEQKSHLFSGISESLSLLFMKMRMSRLWSWRSASRMGASFCAVAETGSKMASTWNAGESGLPGIFTTLGMGVLMFINKITIQWLGLFNI